MTERRRPRRTRAATKSRRPRAAGKIPAPRPDWFLNSPYLQEAGVPVTAETATQVSAVYGCCRLIVDSLASAPVVVYEMKSGGRREIRHDDPTAYILNYGASLADAPDSLPAQAIEEALFWSALGHGNGYAEIQRDLSGRFFALWPIESERVIPRRDETGFYYEVRQPEGGTGRIEPANMLRVPGPSLHGWTGDSTIYRAAKAIGIAQAAQVFAGAYYANSGIIAGVLSSDKIVTPAQADRAIEEWNKQHRGPRAAHGIAVTGQGLKYQPISHDAQQSQLIEARRFQVQEVARFFGVPTTLLADNEAWTNLSELYLGFYRNALLPWAERFDAAATRTLFPQRQPWREVKHDLTQLVMGSFKERVEALRSAVNGGLKTRNEARAILGDNTIGPDGDVLMVETMVKPLDQALVDLKSADLKALPEVYQYHLEQGITTKNEVRARLGLPPVDGGDEFTEPAQIKVDEHQAELQQEAAESAPPSDDAEEDADEIEKRGPTDREVPRKAALVMLAREFDRFARKLKNRKPSESLEKFRDVLVADCAHVQAFMADALGSSLSDADLYAAAMGIEQGEPPDLAANRVLGAA